MQLFSDRRILAFLTIMMGSGSFAYGPNVVSCWKNWLKMTDDNYAKALERYDTCGKLADDLTKDARDRYKRLLLDNLQRSSNYFFDHTEKSPAEVIRVLRSANHLMESWVKRDNNKGGKGEISCCICTTTECPTPKTSASMCPSVDDDDDEDDDDEPCSDEAVDEGFPVVPRVHEKRSPPVKRCRCRRCGCECSCVTCESFKKTRMLFYGFIGLLVLQSLLLLILFCTVCCTDLLTHFPTCSYETQCCCDDDKEWITKLINECESHLKNQECYPLLLDKQAQKTKSATAISYGTNIGKRGKRDDEIFTDLTPLSSPRIGSDSEFEALMNTRPIRKA